MTDHTLSNETVPTRPRTQDRQDTTAIRPITWNKQETTAWPGTTTWGVLVVWFLAALAAGVMGAFTPDPGRAPINVVLAVGSPIVLFLIAYAAIARFRRFVLALDLRLLTIVQSWRILGAMFLVLYAHGLLPGSFAWPAGVGDALVGLAAPVALLSMVAGHADWRRHVLWLNLAGLLDFVSALGFGLLSSGSAFGVLGGPVTTDIMMALPLSLIPTFFVPLWILIHLASLLQLHAAAPARD